MLVLTSGLIILMRGKTPGEKKISGYSIKMANYKKGAKKAGRWIKKEGKWVYKKIYGSRTPAQAVNATAKVAKDVAGLMYSVAQIRSRLNVEKHHKDFDVVTTSFGQCSGSNEGFFAYDVTPSISQGVGQAERKGNSLKMTGMSFPISFQGQEGTHSARKIRVSLLKVKSADNGVASSEAFTQYWDTNPLNGLRDYNAPRNYRNGSHDGITCIRSKTYMLKTPHSVLNNTLKEQSHFTAKFNVKLNDILRYDANSDTKPDGIRYIIVFQADAGNSHPTTVATYDVPITDVSTGISLRLSQRVWYVDN